MKSKTSCFNKTIFLKNFTRFWPIWALYLVILFFRMPVSLFLRTRVSVQTDTQSVAAEKLSSMLSCVESNLTPILVFCFAIISAIAVFSYLYNSRSCNMIHALPVKRTELFITNYISGFLFLIIPQIITFLLSLCVCILNNVTSVEYLFFWLIYTIGMSFLFYSGAVFCCMLTGQYLAGFIFYVLGNTAYVLFKYLIASIISTLCFGLTGVASNQNLSATKDGFFSPLIYLMQKVKITWGYDSDYYNITQIHIAGGDIIACYTVPAVILIIGAVMLYRKRQLEYAGDVLSLKWMKPVFRWLVAFCVGTGFAMIFAQLFFVDTRYCGVVLAVCTVLFSCVCFFIAEMLLCKKFRVFQKKRWMEWIVCACASLALLGAINADLFRLERRIPDTEDIRAAVISNDYDIVCSSDEDLEKIRDIHRSIVEHRKEYENYFYDYVMTGNASNVVYEETAIDDTVVDSQKAEDAALGPVSYVSISYVLKNGKTMKRGYYIPLSQELLNTAGSTAEKIKSMQQDPETYLKYQICENYKDIHFQSGGFNILRNDAEEYIDLTAEQTQTLFEAFVKDLMEGNVPYGIQKDDHSFNRIYVNYISFDGRINGSQKLIYDVLPDQLKDSYSANSMTSFSVMSPGNGKETTSINTSFYLYDSCKHTIQALTDLGIIQSQDDLTYQIDYENTDETEYTVP